MVVLAEEASRRAAEKPSRSDQVAFRGPTPARTDVRGAIQAAASPASVRTGLRAATGLPSTGAHLRRAARTDVAREAAAEAVDPDHGCGAVRRYRSAAVTPTDWVGAD